MLKASLALMALLSSACVEHQVRFEPPAAPGPYPPGAIIDTRSEPEWQHADVYADGLPADRRVSAWALDAEGQLHRGDLQLLSPLPWWQRFPADIVTDLLWPGTLTITASGRPALEPQLPLTIADLDRLAAEAGYDGRP